MKAAIQTSARLWARLGDRRVTLFSLAVLIAAWVGVTEFGLVDDLFLPGPVLLWDALVDLVENGYHNRTIWEHAGLSLERVLVGFVTGAIVGTGLGLAMGYNRKIEAFFNPLVEFFRPLPQLAYLVLLVAWFGIAETAQIILLFLTALPVSAIAARDGVKAPRSCVCGWRARWEPTSGRSSATWFSPRRCTRSSRARALPSASSTRP